MLAHSQTPVLASVDSLLPLPALNFAVGCNPVHMLASVEDYRTLWKDTVHSWLAVGPLYRRKGKLQQWQISLFHSVRRSCYIISFFHRKAQVYSLYVHAQSSVTTVEIYLTNLFSLLNLPCCSFVKR